MFLLKKLKLSLRKTKVALPALSCAALSVWNKLRDNLKYGNSINSFKYNIKKKIHQKLTESERDIASLELYFMFQMIKANK